MGRRFNPADYNPVANPSLAKANNPFRLWGALLIAGLAFAASLHLFRPEIEVRRATLEFVGERAVAKTEVNNRSYADVWVTVRFTIGVTSDGTETSSGWYRVSDFHDVTARVASLTTMPLSFDFPMPRTQPNAAEAQLVNVK
jgi:hypothetical protein